MSTRILAGIAAAIALSTVTVGTASADPANRNTFGPIHVTCPAAGQFDVVGHGSGDFAAVQVIGSTKVLVPLAFTNAAFTYTDPLGNVDGPNSEPDNTKGVGKQSGEWCTYAFSISTGNGSENYSGGGQVLARITAGK